MGRLPLQRHLLIGNPTGALALGVLLPAQLFAWLPPFMEHQAARWNMVSTVV